MHEATIITWILIIWGTVTCGPLLFVQGVMLIAPRGKKAKNLIIGKDQEWRDQTHFKSALAGAYADWLIFVPLFIVGIIGVLAETVWGYVLLGISGAIQLYINVYLFVLEKEYVYPAAGPWAYFTYYWGNFIYWGAASVAYSLLRLGGVKF